MPPYSGQLLYYLNVYRNDPTVCKTCYIKLHQTGSNSTVAEAHDTYCLHSFYVSPLITSLTISCVGGGGGGEGYACVVVSYSVAIFRLGLRSRLYVMKNCFSIPYWDIDISAASIPAVEPNPAYFTMHTGGSLYLPVHVTDLPHPYSAEYKNTACNNTCIVVTCLGKHRSVLL